MASTNVYKDRLTEKIEEHLQNFVTQYPDKVRVNNQLWAFKKVCGIKCSIDTDYFDKDLLLGKDIQIKTNGEMSFEGKTDKCLNFDLKFIARSIQVSYNSEKEIFNISDPQEIIFHP